MMANAQTNAERIPEVPTGLVAMLRHRRRPVVVHDIRAGKRHTHFAFSGGLRVLDFGAMLKKSDVQTLLEDPGYADRDTLLVVARNISRMAVVLATTHGVETLPYAAFVLDRLAPAVVPAYRRMPEALVAAMERHHRCARDHWPVLLRDDPVAVYMGLRPGTCVIYGAGNVRIVK